MSVSYNSHVMLTSYSQYLPPLSVSSRPVATGMCRTATTATGYCWPSLPPLATDLFMTPSSAGLRSTEQQQPMTSYVTSAGVLESESQLKSYCDMYVAAVTSPLASSQCGDDVSIPDVACNTIDNKRIQITEPEAEVKCESEAGHVLAPPLSGADAEGTSAERHCLLWACKTCKKRTSAAVDRRKVHFDMCEFILFEVVCCRRRVVRTSSVGVVTL